MYAVLPVFASLLIFILAAFLYFHQNMTDILTRIMCTAETAETMGSASLYVVAGKAGWGYKLLLAVHVLLHLVCGTTMIHLGNFVCPSDRIKSLSVITYAYYFMVIINTAAALLQDPALLYIPEPFMSYGTYVFIAFLVNSVVHAKLMTEADVCYEDPDSEIPVISLKNEDGHEKHFLLYDELYHFADYCLLSPMDSDEDEIEIFELTPNADRETDTYERVTDEELRSKLFKYSKLLSWLCIIPGIRSRVERFTREKSEKTSEDEIGFLTKKPSFLKQTPWFPP